MKRLVIIITSIMLLFGMSAPVYARGYRQPPKPTPPVVAPPPVITPVSSPNLCMNYGHQADTYNMAQVAIDLANLKKADIMCLRLSYMGFNNAQSEALALVAKADGFRVILGGDWGTMTVAQEPTYTAEALQQAKWAQANAIPQMSIGNEQEYGLKGLSDAQWATYITGLATQVKTIYSGQVSYETSGDFANIWAKQSLGGLDLLGLNLYCGESCNASYLNENIKAHGISHIYVSETNDDMSVSPTPSDSKHATELQGDLVQLLKIGVPVYYFTYGTCNNADGVPSYWGLYNCNVLAQPDAAGVLGL